MNLNEAIDLLKKNKYLVESLSANKDKLYAIMDRHLKRMGYYEEPWHTARYYIINASGKKSNRFVVYKNEKITKDPEFIDSLKDSCERSGFYCNTEPYNRIIITPKTTSKIINHSSNKVYYHISKCPTIDKTGLRIRDRMYDDMFDIYEGRIYLSNTDSSKLRNLIKMVLNEHRMRASEINLYEVRIPEGYEIYGDPTVNNAVYVTNSIPAKYIKKLDIKDYITPRIFKMLDKPLNFRNDKRFCFEIYDILNTYIDNEYKYDIFKRSEEVEKLTNNNTELIQQMYLDDKTAHTVAKELMKVYKNQG